MGLGGLSFNLASVWDVGLVANDPKLKKLQVGRSVSQRVVECCRYQQGHGHEPLVG